MALIADRYSWEVDEWREKFEMTHARLEACEREREYHTARLEQTVAWLAVRLQEAENRLCDCITSGNTEKPKQHGADPHAKNCAVYRTT